MIWLLLAPALAGPDSTYRLVREGDTVESIAEALGEPDLVEPIRSINGLAAGAQPEVGALLRIPSEDDSLSAGQGRIESLSGEAEVTPPGCAVERAFKGMRLPAESRICTADDGFVTLRTVPAPGREGDDLLLLPNTCITLDASSERAGGRSSLISLNEGSLRVLSGGTSPGEVIVRTDSAVAAGRSGGFRVTVEGDAATRAEALYNAIELIGAGEQISLDAGEGSRVMSGEAPQMPILLLDSAQLIAPADGAPLRRPDFSWNPLSDALGYRVEISATPDFTEPVLVKGVSETSWQPESLLLPYSAEGLWWRVASFDRFGFVGIPSEPRWLDWAAGVGQ